MERTLHAAHGLTLLSLRKVISIVFFLKAAGQQGSSCGFMVICCMITEANLINHGNKDELKNNSHEEVRSKGESGKIGVGHVWMNVPHIL